MNRSWLSALALALFLSGAALAGGTGAASAWLGNRVDVAQTAFCRANGCKLVEVRRNNDSQEGWHDGTHLTYRLKGGERLEVSVRPGGWISNAFLLRYQAERGSAFTSEERRQAAEFLSVVTGRSFSARAVASCVSAGIKYQSRNVDAYGPDSPLSHWTTPKGLPYKARCGVAGAGPLGVWAGWMQQ
jgi:hypothetical protein